MILNKMGKNFTTPTHQEMMDLLLSINPLEIYDIRKKTYKEAEDACIDKLIEIIKDNE